MIALFTAAMSAGKAPAVHGDGLQARDFTYVANAVQALERVKLRGETDPDLPGLPRLNVGSILGGRGPVPGGRGAVS